MSETGARRPELLAPAGDWQAMRAAVANGADAVYFGLTRYSARQRAANFRREELPEVIRYLHGHNVRGYVTLNTLIFSDELAEAADLTAAIASAGADAVIVQDLGLARLIHRLAPSLPVHASTQMTLTEPEGIELARSLGVSRVILPKPGAKSPARRQHEHQSWFRRGRRWHAGIEGRISVVKRKHGLGRCLDHGENGFGRWIGWGVIAANLAVMGRTLATRA
jgi:putative protease